MCHIYCKYCFNISLTIILSNISSFKVSFPKYLIFIQSTVFPFVVFTQKLYLEYPPLAKVYIILIYSLIHIVI